MSLTILPGPRRTALVAKHFCSRCNLNTDHMLLRRWTGESGNSDTFIKAESWICCFCDTIHEKRREVRKPTEETMIVRRLLKLSGDYEQIRRSTLEVEGDTVTLRLKLFPWSVVQASKRVREAKNSGFYRLGDLWRLEQHGLLKNHMEDDARSSLGQVSKSGSRAGVVNSIQDEGWT